MDEVTSLLSRLIALPSVNPMGRPATDPNHLEGRVTDFLDAYFRALRVDCQRIPIAPGRDNLIAVYDAPRARRSLLWDVHQDTVPVDGMTIPPFEPRIHEGRLHGRGACDVKGSMAAMLVAFTRLVETRPEGAARVVLACTVDEEYTHIGSSHLAEHRPDVDLAIVAEPTSLDLVTTHKGAVRWRIHTRGVACHSSTPALGDNAIYRMARILSALEEHASELAASDPHPVLGTPTLSVGRIEGGVSVNVVPDQCTIEVDRRLVPGEEVDTTPDEVRALLSARLGGLDQVHFDPPWVRMPALESRVPGAWLDRFSAVIAARTGRPPAIKGVPFGTDAGPLGETGLPCLVLGPGDIAQAHTRDEWVELAQVRAAVDVYHDLAVAFGRL